MANNRILSFEQCISAADVRDGVILSRDGSITIGWELTPPQETSVSVQEYDTLTSMLCAAMRSLPEWTLVHRQDIYSRRRYHSEAPAADFLEESYNRHFEGRGYLEHREFIWFSMNPARFGKAGPLKPAFTSSVRGIGYHSPDLSALEETLSHFISRCTEFVSVFPSACAYSVRRLQDEDIAGVPGGPDGLMEQHRRWFASEHEGTDISVDGGTYLDRDTRRMFSYSFSRADDMPAQVSNMIREHTLSSPESDIFLSSASPIGGALQHEHITNFYFVYPSQGEILRELDRRRKNMTAFSKGSAENGSNARAISEFIDMIHSRNTVALYSHYNIIVWGDREEEMRMRGDVGAALSLMGMRGKLNTIDTAQLWLASLPGGQMEVGEDNYMLCEMEQALCLGIAETYTRDYPQGLMRLTDRRRHVPVRTDFGKIAYEQRLIESGNAVILGPTGSGKSFFTNAYVAACYRSGQHVFIIDKGDSYEGLCTLIREESGGQDGVYYTWSAEHPFAFAPLTDCRQWLSDPESMGLSYFTAMLKIMWTPQQGWGPVTDPILYRMITDFIGSLPKEVDTPVFDDFYDFVSGEVAPKIYETDHGSLRGEGYIVGTQAVTSAQFNIRDFCLAMTPYVRGGQFSMILNEKHPADLFKSRFVVFEVDTISKISPSMYALCTFNIIHAFERKMHSGEDTFRLLFIEEAWQAIATEGTAEYLKALWKTARKYHTSAAVVTQQVSDIVSSQVIRDAIVNNSPVKILLDQKNNAAAFDDIAAMMGLSPLEQAQVRSIGRDIPAGAKYREVFISLGGKRSGVFALEVSEQEALVYESDKVRKAPMLERARESGSIRRAVSELTEKRTKS